METIVLGNVYVFIIVAGIGILIGLDLKKWRSWLYGIYGFLSGLLVGLLHADFSGGLTLGALFAFIVMYGGATSYLWRQRFKK